ncbi:MAG: hypothetical protein ACOYMA_00300 [Bacteroidia bacterium]
MRKIAQHSRPTHNDDDFDFPFSAEVDECETDNDNDDADDDTADEDYIEEESQIEVSEHGDKGEPKTYIFKLDIVPGAGSDTVEEMQEEVEIDEKTNTPVDDWDWESGGLSKFLEWLEVRFKGIPQHKGQDTTGVERALAYFQRLDTEISRAMKKDYKREIDASSAEEARTEIMNGMDRLIERLEKLRNKKFKKNKKAGYNAFVKTAETSTTGRMIVNVPYFISNVARTCIDATVQGGKDMEEVFVKVAKEYDLDKREKSQVVQLIKDMGYPMMLDRVNPFKPINPSSSEVSEYMTQYYA